MDKDREYEDITHPAFKERDNPYVDMKQAFRERWTVQGDITDPTSLPYCPVAKSLANVAYQRPFNKIVDDWMEAISKDLDKKTFGDEDSPEHRINYYFGAIETDKQICTINFVTMRRHNVQLSFSSERQIIALAVHQYAIMEAAMELGFQPSHSMQKIELLPHIWGGFMMWFNPLIDEDRNNVLAKPTDKWLLKRANETQRHKAKALDRYKKKNALPQFSDSSTLTKDSSAKSWNQLYMQVEMANGKWFIKAKWTGEGRYKTYELKELRFANRSGKPFKTFEVLRKFAQGGGFLEPSTVTGGLHSSKQLEAIERLKQQIVELRKKLRLSFGINDDPIIYNKSDGTYYIQFAECGANVAPVQRVHPSDYQPRRSDALAHKDGEHLDDDSLRRLSETGELNVEELQLGQGVINPDDVNMYDEDD